VSLVTGLLERELEELQVSVSVVYSRPGSPGQEWHADGPHVGQTAGWTPEDGNEDPPYAICVFLPLIDLNPERGFTQFWPGTHAYDGLLGFGGVGPLVGAAVDATVDAGSAVLYDYRLMHRGMPNRSQEERPILQFIYNHKDYTETRNYGQRHLYDSERAAAPDVAPVHPLPSEPDMLFLNSDATW